MELSFLIAGIIAVSAVIKLFLGTFMIREGKRIDSGSVNIEIDCSKTVEEVYSRIHSLQLRIMHEYHVTMVFGIYAVNNDRGAMKEMRSDIAQFVREHEHIKSYHALYVDPKNNDIYCDQVVDYSAGDWEALKEEFRTYMQKRYPQNRMEIVVETEHV